MGKKIFYILIILFLVFLLPKNIYAQSTGGGGGGCTCGQNPTGNCNVNCDYVTVPPRECDSDQDPNTPGCQSLVGFSQCNGPNDCAGASCGGGVCGGGAECTPKNCPSVTTPDWTTPQYSCAPWGANVVCGNKWKRTNHGPGCGKYCSPDDKPCKYSRVAIATCVPTCTGLTAPSNIQYNNGVVTWTMGTGGTDQVLNIKLGAVTIPTGDVYGLSSFPITLLPNTSYTVEVVNFKDISCYKSSGVKSITTPTELSSWWQVKDGDVTSGGDLVSQVPTGKYFDAIGSGGTSGVPVFGGLFSLSDLPSKISISKWNSNTKTVTSRLYNRLYR